MTVMGVPCVDEQNETIDLGDNFSIERQSRFEIDFAQKVW